MPPTEASSKISGTVRVALREAGVPQAEAAGWINVSPATMERRLSGRGKPFDTTELEWISDHLGITVFDLMRRAESEAAA